MLVSSRHTLLYHALLLVHILGALTFFAGVVLAGLVLARARHATMASEVASILSLARIGVLLVAIGALVAGAFGLLLVWVGHYGFGSGWVVAAIVTYVGVVVLGGLGGAIPKRARLLATELGPVEVSQQLRDLLWDTRSRLYNDVAFVLMLVLIYLMVFKP